MGGVLLYLYAMTAASTIRLAGASRTKLQEIPSPCVLAIWHGSSPSLLVALRAAMLDRPFSILVATDPRGDCLAILCACLGMRVVRGDASHGGEAALETLTRDLSDGRSVIVTADGGGPRYVAKLGAVALASVTGLPLIPIGADCRPALAEPRKWDVSRNPVPFGSIVIVVGECRYIPGQAHIETLEDGRRWLERALNECMLAARNSLRRGSSELDGEVRS